MKHANDMKRDVAFVPPLKEEVKAKLASGIGSMFKKKDVAAAALPDFIELFSGEEEISADNFVSNATDEQ